MAKMKKTATHNKKNQTISKKENKGTKKNSHIQDVKKQTTDEVTKFVEVILVLLVIFTTFYLITYWVNKNKKETNLNSTVEDTIIQYDEILLGRLFLQNTNEYYVLILEDKNSYKNIYQPYINSYMEKENALRLYRAYLDNAFNRTYKAEDSNMEVESIESLKVKTTSLLKIKEHKIIETIEGKDEVLKKLTEISK